jgi:hypothetical protein
MVKQIYIEEWHALKKIEKRYRRKNGLLSYLCLKEKTGLDPNDETLGVIWLAFI